MKLVTGQQVRKKRMATNMLWLEVLEVKYLGYLSPLFTDYRTNNNNSKKKTKKSQTNKSMKKKKMRTYLRMLKTVSLENNK